MAHRKSLYLETDSLFAENMTTLRKARGYSFSTFADLLATRDVPLERTAVAKIEALERRASVGEACVISDLLSVPLADMISRRLTAEITIRSTSEEVDPQEWQSHLRQMATHMHVCDLCGDKRCPHAGNLAAKCGRMGL